MNLYDSVDVHRRMIEDRTRTASFHRSIRASVKPGDVVLDVGAGTGILSLFAAQAGASRVYALERAPGAARMARRLIDANGVADRVHVLEGDSEHLWALEPVDVLVSEWLGVYAVDENMLAPVLTARDRWLKPGGLMIPHTTTTWLAPVCNAAGEEANAFHTSAYGIDLSPIAPYSLDEAVWLPNGAARDDVRASPQPLWVVEPTTMPAARARKPFVGEITFTLDGPVNGLAIWFSAEMPGTDPLSNEPGTTTHWGNFLFPIRGSGDASRGDRLHVRFTCIPVRGGACEHAWSARLNDGPIEVHDTRRHRRPWGSPPWRATFAGA
jgi:protein arginine N-methyltransferase 6